MRVFAFLEKKITFSFFLRKFPHKISLDLSIFSVLLLTSFHPFEIDKYDDV
jgi:hypothetical protein